MVKAQNRSRPCSSTISIYLFILPQIILITKKNNSGCDNQQNLRKY